jgi:preprotein translocase subunit SecA
MWQPIRNWITRRWAHRTLRPWRMLVAQTLERVRAEEAVPLTDLPRRWQGFAERWRRGTGRDAVRVEALAILCRLSRECCALNPHPGQLLAAFALDAGTVVEMPTGEGKTLALALAAALATFDRQSVHVATSNDYLVDRDATLNRPIFNALGLSVGAIRQETSPRERHAAYRCDITYATPRELGFDFLRECHRQRGPRRIQAMRQGRQHAVDPDWRQAPGLQPPRYALFVDEADSLLIDEARIPLLLATVDRQAELHALLTLWAAERVRSLEEPRDYFRKPFSGRWTLTPTGLETIRNSAPVDLPVTLSEMTTAVELLLRAARDLRPDRDYIVRDGQVVLVDEFTGRLAEGRQWQAGVQQAVEAWCALPLTPRTSPTARITVQEFFGGYSRLAGITGTALESAGEFHAMYRRRVVEIPAQRPSQRITWPLLALDTEEEKFRAVVAETIALRQTGRPVLVGARSIDKSERLSALLNEAGMPHQLLHAKHLDDEARRVALAGQPGQITIATNLAGRGTDIALGPGVAELGGLHVIGTELHESSRIDRQLFGRCARQGDPGSSRQFVSLDDSILDTAWGSEGAGDVRRIVRREGRPPPHRWGRLLRRAQRKVEQQLRLVRAALVREAIDRRQRLLNLGCDPVLDFFDEH